MSLMFQETSAESFEESLMAGGYGRYVRPPFDHAPLVMCSWCSWLCGNLETTTCIYCPRFLYWCLPMLTIS